MSVPDRSDKKAFAEYAKGILDAWVSGKPLEVRLELADEWERRTKADIPPSFAALDYRLAPEAPRGSARRPASGTLPISTRKRGSSSLTGPA